MKNTIKLAGLTAAALLAVAPVATTTVSAATTPVATAAATAAYTDVHGFNVVAIATPTDRAQVYAFNDKTNKFDKMKGKELDKSKYNDWFTDTERTMKDGKVYYRVATNEWLLSTDTTKPTFDPAYDEEGYTKVTGSVTLQKGAVYTAITTFKAAGIDHPDGVEYRGTVNVDGYAKDENGYDMYRISMNHWITPGANSTINVQEVK